MTTQYLRRLMGRIHGGWTIVSLLLMLASGQVLAAASVRVQVMDPYLEIHAGPGRGYPIFHVVDRSEWVTLLERHTDWFQVETEKGKTGWVARHQLERTLTEAGIPATFRDTLVTDYLQRRVEAGFSVGRLKEDMIISAHVGAVVLDNIGVELTLAQAAGDLSSTQLLYVSLMSHPFPQWRVAPFFSLGYGKFNNVPNPTLIGASEVDVKMANVGIGVRAYLTRRFLLRGDYRRHIAYIDESNNNAYSEISAGVAFFF
jgi:Bacterial SH3 domain